MKVKILQDLFSRRIAKRDIPDLHLPIYLLQYPCALLIRLFRQFIHQAEHPLRRRKGRLKFSYNIGCLIDWTGKLP